MYDDSVSYDEDLPEFGYVFIDRPFKFHKDTSTRHDIKNIRPDKPEISMSDAI